MKFVINCTKPIYNDAGDYVDTAHANFVYDNETSEIFNEKGKLVNIRPATRRIYNKTDVLNPVSVDTPGKKSRNVKILKIQMGLSCNYSCEYCSQRFVPNIEHSNTKLMYKFIEGMDDWLEGAPERIEYWGGEPFVYWKTFKPLAEKLREKFPKTQFTVITNGSLITDEIIDWLYYLGFSLSVSHDGPGQNVRGPDPFDDPEQRKILFKLFNRFLPEGRISVNSMIHRENMDREKIQLFFEELFNLGPNDPLVIGEGGFIDVYDEGGRKNVPQNTQEHVAHRRLTLKSIREGNVGRFGIVRDRIQGWIDSWANYSKSSTLGQKCGMDDEGTLSVDLNGNVLTCQNVTAVSKAPNGKSHRIGHVKSFDNIKLNTATHWKFREECSKCPVLQVCKGSCMFLQGEYFKLSCDAAYSDHIPFFSAAFEAATQGYLPYKITALSDEYNLPKDREDLWGAIMAVDPSFVEVRNIPVNLEGKAKDVKTV